MKIVKRLHNIIFSVFTITICITGTVKAETMDCTAITSLPYTISSSGIYCLTGDLSTNASSGNAIEITVNNVTLDLNGWRLGGLSAGVGTSAAGIYANQHKNITIKNGTIRGFYVAIILDDSSPYTTSQGHVIEDIRAEQNRVGGLLIEGRGSIVRNNQIVDTGGSTLTGFIDGIQVSGSGVRVLNNDIIGVEGADIGSPGDAYGINAFDAGGSVIADNRVDNITVTGTGSAHGIRIASSSDVLATDNRITNVTNTALLYATSSGKYMNNLTYNVGTAFSGGTPIGINN